MLELGIIYFIGLFTDARVRNKNIDLIVFLFLFSYIKNKNKYVNA